MLAGTSHTATGIAAVGQAVIVLLVRRAITILAGRTHPETDTAPVGSWFLAERIGTTQTGNMTGR